MDERALKLIMSKVDERVKDILNSMGSGSAGDYANYREMVGYIRGLLHTKHYIEDLLEQTKEDDDE